MSDAWQTLSRAILEARSKGPLQDLLDYVASKHGDHAADELRDFVQGNSLADVRRHVALKYMDPRADELAKGLVAMAGAGSPGGQGSRPTKQAHPGRTTDKGSGPSEPIPQRPRGDRPVPSGMPAPTRVAPGEKPSHDPGTAGIGRVKPQPSVDAGVDPSHTTVVKPTKPGSFVGQHWQPSAYSAPEKSKESDEVAEVERELEREIDKPRPDLDLVKHLQAKLGILQRRAGGFKQRSVQHGSQATGQMSKGAVRQNPARPGSVVRREKDPEGNMRTVRWQDEHPGWFWAGPEHGWVSKSEFVSLVGAKKVRPERPT